jgi:syntaxin 1A/syntaxin 1B/2/3
MPSDRLAELRRMRQKESGGSGTSDPEAPMSESPAAASDQPEENPLDDFFAQADRVQQNIGKVDAAISEMEKLQSTIMSNTIPEKQAQYSQQLDSVIEDTNAVINVSKKMLDVMAESNKKEEKNGVTTMTRLRDNQHRQLSKDFIDCIRRFQTVQTAYKDKFKDRIRREVAIVNPDASPDEIEAIVESGADQVFADNVMSQKHAEASHAYQLIQEQHRDILRIEDSLMELHSMFVDMAALVDMQGEVLNNIEKNVSKALDYTEKGVEELKKASKYQKAARKKMCIIIIIVLVIAIIIAVPIIATTRSQQ